MRRETRGPWVVYLMAVHGKADGMRAVCEQSEWDAMQRAKPGALTLIQQGITNEGEAEKLARGTSGDRIPSTHKKKKDTTAPAAAVVGTPWWVTDPTLIKPLSAEPLPAAVGSTEPGESGASTGIEAERV